MSEAKTERFPRSPSERYEVVEAIGRGGMAHVFAARDMSLSRTVALKCMKEDLAAETDLRERFFNEAEILAALHHPGVVPVYDIGELNKNEFFYAMEKVRGKTLTAMLRDRTDEEITSRHDLVRYVDIFEKVCQTVGYAHSRRIIHRDIKPGNIMVDDYGAVYVVDWGLAKRLPVAGSAEEIDSLTMPGVMMGTPSHMSPEQAQGLPDAGDARTDVFALGVVLYQILTGSRPFRGKTKEETIKEVMFHDPDPPARHNPAANRELSAICMKALRKDPRRRYADAGELAEDIARHRAFLPVSAIRPRLLDRAFNWVRRNRVISAALGTLLAVVVLGGGYLSIQKYSDKRLVDEFKDWVVMLDAKRDELIPKVAEVEEQLGRLGPDSPGWSDLVIERERKEAELTVVFMNKRSILAAIIGFTYFSPDKDAKKAARDQVKTALESLMHQQDFALAEALAASTLDGALGENVVGYGAEDITLLREIHANAGIMLERKLRTGG